MGRSGASEVLPGLFVGGRADAARFRGVRIYVSEDPLDERWDVEAQLPVYDPTADAPNLPNLDRLADLIARNRAETRPVLVFCGHGIRRGPLGVAWYLHRREGMTLADAYARIREVRPGVEEAAEWLGHAEALEDPSRAAPARPGERSASR